MDEAVDSCNASDNGISQEDFTEEPNGGVKHKVRTKKANRLKNLGLRNKINHTDDTQVHTDEPHDVSSTSEITEPDETLQDTSADIETVSYDGLEFKSDTTPKKKKKRTLGNLKKRQPPSSSNSENSLKSAEVVDLQELKDDSAEVILSDDDTLKDDSELLDVSLQPSESTDTALKTSSNFNLADDLLPSDEESSELAKAYEDAYTASDQSESLSNDLLTLTSASITSSGISESVPDLTVKRKSKNWDLIKTQLGINDFQQTISDKTAFSVSSSTPSLHTVKISKARHKNFLVGQKGTTSSLMGAEELDRILPDKNIKLFVGTWNVGECSVFPHNLRDFVLPEKLQNEDVPEVLVIATQENTYDKTQWEIELQTTIGLHHVLFHSTQLGTLHLAVFIKRELIWFCSVAEEDSCAVRAFEQIKTKGAVAISLTLFGTSMVFIGSHFKANEGKSNYESRCANFASISKTLKLPQLAISNTLQRPSGEISDRFDCIFWAGDLNFRLNKDKNEVKQMINSQKFETLLEFDELTSSISENLAFQLYQEGRILFPPTYKFDTSTNEYSDLRIPSYTDRILFKSKKKHGVVCLAYNSVREITMSDHKPVYSLFQVNIKPGVDTIPLANGLFRRDVYIEAAKRRSQQRDFLKSKLSSSICSIM